MGEYAVTEGSLTISVADVGPDEVRRTWDVSFAVSDGGGNVWSTTDVVNTPMGATRDEVIGTSASFLSAWCESVEYSDRTGRVGENVGLFSFPREVASVVSSDAELMAFYLSGGIA